ncbi:MAG: phosphate-starvation-inducible PsiE family protein [Methylophilaceae bacterium]|nr:phosphate-starvation-inducible PsiE family protein [Methylophilaceae bacterium]
MAQQNFPNELGCVNSFTVKAMLWLNGLAHIIIGLALAVTVIMFTWLFFQDIQKAIYASNLVHGFLHALGTLMLLWTISALIMAEVRYLQGCKLEVDTFIEVGMVVMLRKLIVLPVQDASPNWGELMMWVGAAFMLGIMFAVVRWGQRLGESRRTRSSDKNKE